MTAAPDDKARDRAGAEFWEDWWKGSRLPAPLDPYRSGLKNYVVRKFHRRFERLLEGYATSSMELIEVGCAQSVFLPYFAKYFGFKVAGIDRSGRGCDRARAILSRENVPGEIYEADLFAPPAQLLERFDLLVSFGVVEHFDPTADALIAMARLLRPGGRMFSTVPNFTRLLGAYQKLLDRALYNAHVPLGRESLAAAHRQAGLEIESCDYFLPICLEVCNLESWRKSFPYWFTIRSHTAISRAVWFVDEHLFSLPPNPWTSPYVFCVSRKPPGSK